MATVAFEVRPVEDGRSLHQVCPQVNGTDLRVLVEEYEEAMGWDPAGGYGGLIPSIYDHGPIRSHYLGEAERDGKRLPGPTALLGCLCGEWGCWPLLADIDATPDEVTWANFTQPHRKERVYEGLGPFVFDRRQYEDALEVLSDLPEYQP